MKVFLILSAVLVRPQADDWEKFIRETNALKDGEVALRQIGEKAADLERDRAGNRVKLAELLVRCKLGRVPPMQRGAAALEAIGILEEEIAAKPDHVYARYLLGRTCLGLPPFFKRKDSGLEQFRWLAAKERKTRGSAPYPDVFLVLGQHEAESDRWDAAKEIVAAGRGSFPDDRPLRDLALRLSAGPAKGDFPAATRAFHAALKKGKLEFDVLDAPLRDSGKVASLQRGLLRLWALEASRGGPVSGDPGKWAGEAIEHFEEARRLDPADARIDGWLGSIKTAIGLRSALPAMEREGWDLIDRSVSRHPQFAVFVRALARDDQRHLAPEADREKLAAQVEEELHRTIEVATGTRMDRSRFLVPEGAASVARAGAGDSTNAPYNRTGTFFWAGEFFRERSQWVKAADAYSEALRLDEKKSWPFRAAAEKRLEVSREKKAARLESPVSCLLCHQSN